jgi:HD-GYP domain-containing protein (c-di-GMP phosphodiesterase class II)
MRKKIPVEDLRPGMYVNGFEEPWLRTPFLWHRFTVRNENQIRKMRDYGLTHVYIDPGKGREVDRPAAEEEMRIQGEKAYPPASMTQEQVKRYVRLKDSLLQIERETLLKGSYINFSLYIKNGIQIRPLAQCDKREIEIDGSILGAEGEMLIDQKDMKKYRAYLEGLIKVETPGLPAREIRNRVIKANTKMLIKELLSEPRSGNTVRQCKEAVEEIINAVKDSGGLVSGLLTINKHDYYTYTHSVEVSVLSVGLASAMGLDRDRELFSIGIGSLLHDIGKSAVPTEILNKPARLSEQEFSIMKQHVIRGKSLIDLYEDIPADALPSLLEHHERMSGRGYPLGLKGDDIHVSGRIVAISDVYDAVTTDRAYRRALTPFQSLMLMKEEKGNYDKAIFETFVKMLGNQVGSFKLGEAVSQEGEPGPGVAAGP